MRWLRVRQSFVTAGITIHRSAGGFGSPSGVVEFTPAGDGRGTEAATLGALINANVLANRTKYGVAVTFEAGAYLVADFSPSAVSIYVQHEWKSVEKPFVAAVGYGIASTTGYWSSIRDARVEACGDALNASGGNALTVNNLVRQRVYGEASAELECSPRLDDHRGLLASRVAGWCSSVVLA